MRNLSVTRVVKAHLRKRSLDVLRLQKLIQHGDVDAALQYFVLIQRGALPTDQKRKVIPVIVNYILDSLNRGNTLPLQFRLDQHTSVLRGWDKYGCRTDMTVFIDFSRHSGLHLSMWGLKTYTSKEIGGHIRSKSDLDEALGKILKLDFSLTYIVQDLIKTTEKVFWSLKNAVDWLRRLNSNWDCFGLAAGHPFFTLGSVDGRNLVRIFKFYGGGMSMTSRQEGEFIEDALCR